MEFIKNMLTGAQNSGGSPSRIPMDGDKVQASQNAQAMMGPAGNFEPISSIPFTLQQNEVKDLYFPVNKSTLEISMDLISVTFTGGVGLVANTMIKAVKMWLVDITNRETLFLELTGPILRDIQIYKNQVVLPDNVWPWGFGRQNLAKMLSPNTVKSVHVQVEANDAVTVGGVGCTAFTGKFKAITSYTRQAAATAIYPKFQERKKIFGAIAGIQDNIEPITRFGRLDTLWLITADGDVDDPTNWVDTAVSEIRLVGDGISYLLQDTTYASLVKNAGNKYKYTITGMVPITFAQFPDLSMYSNLDLTLISSGAIADFQVKYIVETAHPWRSGGGN